MMELSLYAHLNKTGGTTVVTSLDNQWTEGKEFYHVDPEGRKRIKAREVQFELNQNLDAVNVLIGHDINESIASYFPNRDIKLYTTLRHPFKRLISQFNYHHASRNVNDIKSLDQFFSLKRNSLCKFYIERFPSLISDPLAPMCLQTLEILSKFFKVYDFGDFENEISGFLSIWNLSFDNKYTSRVGGKDYAILTNELEFDNHNIYENINQDMIVFKKVFSRRDHKYSKIDIQPIIPNLWYKWILFNCTKRHKNINNLKDTLEGSFLMEIVERAQKTIGIDPQFTADALISEYHSMKGELFFEQNALDILNRLLPLNNKWSNRTVDTSNPLSILYAKFFNGANQSFRSSSDACWENIMIDDPIAWEGAFDFNFENKSFEKALTYALKMVKSRPVEPRYFKKLAMAYDKLDDKRNCLNAAEKLIELYPASTYARNIIEEILK